MLQLVYIILYYNKIEQEAEVILNDLNSRFDKTASFARESVGAKGMKYICDNLNKLSNIRKLNLAISETLGNGDDDCDRIIIIIIIFIIIVII